jgi:hypothetical protein
MFSSNQSLTKFILDAFPECKAYFSLAVIVKQSDTNKLEITLFVKRLETTPINNEIKDFLMKFPEVSGVSFVRLGQVLLTDKIVLKTIKILQPIKQEILLKKLQHSNVFFESPELNPILDKLRKQKMIIRSQTGSYSVTEKALSKIPNGKKKNSSDIQRVLVLGKKKW